MITTAHHTEPRDILDPDALTAIVSRTRALRAIALVYPHIVLLQLALSHALPHALRLTLSWQVAIMVALLIIWSAYQRRANRLIRNAARALDGLLCPACLYPMIEHPTAPPPRATCPECGTCTPSNAIRAAWQRGSANPTCASLDTLFEPRKHSTAPANATQTADLAHRTPPTAPTRN